MAGPSVPSAVSIDGGLPEPLPVTEGGLTSFSPDGNKIAYNPIFRNFRTWKRYTGGMAQSISIYDIKNNTIEDVPHTDWTDTFPMWHGDTIYFASDRGAEHRLNLYSYDLNSKTNRATDALRRFRRHVAHPRARRHRVRERRLSLYLSIFSRSSQPS